MTTKRAALLEAARAMAQGETERIPRDCLLFMCEAFGGRDWIGQFDHATSEVEVDYAADFRGLVLRRPGIRERVVALCFAAEVLK